MKISLLGAAGGIGQPLGLLLKLFLPAETALALYDVSPITPGVVMDLSHIPTAITVTGSCTADPTPALQGADIVIIAAGVARKPGMDRNELFHINAHILKSLLDNIAHTCPNACICIITNPLNSMVPLAAELLKHKHAYNKRKLFGISLLDNLRANAFIATVKGSATKTVEVPIIGGHSDTTILPLLSQIPDISLNAPQIDALTHRIRTAGTEVVHAKAGHGSATLSISWAALQFTLSLLRALQGEAGIKVTAYVETENQYSPFFSQLLHLGRSGIATYLPLDKLSLYEKKALDALLPSLKHDITLGQQWAQRQAE